MSPSAGAIEREIREVVDRALQRERTRLARILADSGHVALGVRVETFDDEGAAVDLCYCHGPPCFGEVPSRDPDCDVCRGTGERQPTVVQL